MRGIKRLKYVFLAPAVIWLLVFTIYPLLYSLRMAFHNVKIGQPWVNIGFSNFTRAFQDPSALEAAKVTLIFVVVGVVLQLFFGLLFAVLFNQNIPAREFLRTLMTLPLFATPIAMGFLFITIFYEEGGLINGLLPFKVPWQSRPFWALMSVTIVDIWQWTPFVFIVLLAAIQGIPQEYYEAAKLETSNPLRLFRSITLPILQPTLILVAVLRIAEAFKVFDIPFTLTAGGPGAATTVFSMFIRNSVRRNFDFGYGAALTYLLLIVVSIIITFFFRRIRQAYNE
jgi:multiple sugar transport system permease protein